MFNRLAPQKTFKLALLLCALFTLATSQAQVDYTSIVENRNVVFYHSDESKSLRVDLENTQDPVFVVYQTYDANQKNQFDINSFLQSKMATTNINGMEGALGRVVATKGRHGSSLTLTDFAGIQEHKMNQVISHPLKVSRADAGVLRIYPKDHELFIALSSSANSLMVVNVVQMREVDASELEWDVHKIKGVFDDCMKTATEEDDDEVCDCIKSKVPRQMSYPQYAHLKSQNKQQLIDKLYNACAREYNANRSTSSSQVRAQVDELILLGEQQWRNGEFKEFEQTYKKILAKGRNGDDIYNKLAESYFIQKKYEEFKKNAYLAASTNAYNYFAQAKLIRIALIEKEYDRAVTLYKKNKRNRLPNNMKFSKYMKKELDYMMDLGYVNDDVKKFKNYIGS